MRTASFVACCCVCVFRIVESERERREEVARGARRESFVVVRQTRAEIITALRQQWPLQEPQRSDRGTVRASGVARDFIRGSKICRFWGNERPQVGSRGEGPVRVWGRSSLVTALLYSPRDVTKPPQADDFVIIMCRIFDHHITTLCKFLNNTVCLNACLQCFNAVG